MQQTNKSTIISRRDILWRDFLFLIVIGFSLRIISYVETHAPSSDRTFPPFISPSFSNSSNATSSSLAQSQDSHPHQPPLKIVDAGFCITKPLYIFLKNNPAIHNFLAFVNTLVLLIPAIYSTYVTIWLGDYTLAFRLLATQLFRSFCGWFTYLPPDPNFLMSYLDFPEIAQCIYEDCATKVQQPLGDKLFLPFVSFFSGHVATLVSVANHMNKRKMTRWAVALHILNFLQILRLLATRGHYSIDIIIGWCVAVWFSNPAEKLGLTYSRARFLKDFWSNGASLMDRDHIMEYFWRRMTADEAEDHLLNQDEELYQSETTARIAAVLARDFALRNLEELRKEVEVKGIFIKEIGSLRRKDLIRLLSWAQLSLEELRAEARLLDVKLPMEGMDVRDIINIMWQKAKSTLRDRGEIFLQWLEEKDNAIRSTNEKDILNNNHKKQQ